MLIVKDVNQNPEAENHLSKFHNAQFSKNEKKNTSNTGSDHSFNSFIANNF